MKENTLIGLLAGMLLGAAVAFGTFGDMLIVAFFGALGVIVMKIVQGELDITDVLNKKKTQQ